MQIVQRVCADSAESVCRERAALWHALSRSAGNQSPGNLSIKVEKSTASGYESKRLRVHESSVLEYAAERNRNTVHNFHLKLVKVASMFWMWLLNSSNRAH